MRFALAGCPTTCTECVASVYTQSSQHAPKLLLRTIYRRHSVSRPPVFNTKRAVTHPPPDQHGGESIVIPGGVGVIFQVLSEKPAHMLEPPGPGIVSLPSPLNGRLHDSGLP